MHSPLTTRVGCLPVLPIVLKLFLEISQHGNCCAGRLVTGGQAAVEESAPGQPCGQETPGPGESR